MSIAQRPAFVLDISPAAVGTGNSDFVMSRPGDVIDALILPTVSDGGSTAQFSRQALGAGAFNTITNAMACAASGTVARTTTITVAERSFVSTDVIRLILTSGGAGTVTCKAYLHVLFTAIAGNA